MSAHFVSHVILGTNQVEAAVAFYDRLLGVLGQQQRWRSATGAGYGTASNEGIDTFWIIQPLDGQPATAGNGTNVCFVAPTRHAVDEFHKRELDGNKIVAACHEHVG